MIISSDPFVISSQVLTENTKNVFYGKCFLLNIMCEDSVDAVLGEVFDSMIEQSYMAIGEQ